MQAAPLNVNQQFVRPLLLNATVVLLFVLIHKIGDTLANLTLRLLFQAFVVVVGFLILAGAANTAIVGSNGVARIRDASHTGTTSVNVAADNYALGKFAGRKLILTLTLVVMIMPGASLVLPIFLELNALHLIGSVFSVILPFSFFPFGVYFSQSRLLERLRRCACCLQAATTV